MSFFPSNSRPIGCQVGLSVGATAEALTVPVGASFAVISVETATVRYRDDGTDPTATQGVLLGETTIEPWTYVSSLGLTKIKFIATTGTATLNIAYYG